MLRTKNHPLRLIKATNSMNLKWQKLDFRDPPRMLRMAIVACFFTGPGCLAGALLGVFLGHPFVLMFLGAIVGATAGAMMESS